MNLLYLSAHYPTHYQLFSHRLAGHGVRIFGITDQSDECLSESLRACLVGNYRVDHLSNEEQVLAGARYFQEKFGPIDRVESHLEPWLEMEAIIRQALGIHGPKPGDIEFIRKKSRMKEVFRKAVVPAAHGQIVTDVHAALAFIKGRYPAFIKPDSGVGACDTYTIRSEGDLADFFARKQNYPYFLEEYLSGVIESFDGLTDREGNVVFCTGHVFSNDIHQVVKNNENLWYYSLRKLPADLERLGHAVVKAAEVREKFFHIEFFRLPDGTLMRVFPPGTTGEDAYVSFATTLTRAGISFQKAVVTRADGAVYKSDQRRHLRLVGGDP